MKQLCNLAYALLLENRTPAQVAELEMLLTEPVKKEELMERQNQEAMKELQRRMPPGVGLLVPPPPPPSVPSDTAGGSK
jgi:hypothetical protein